MPHVNQAQRRVRLDGGVLQREHMAAGESEHGGHAVPSRDRDGLRAAMS